jgi:hypothetical protein
MRTALSTVLICRRGDTRLIARANHHPPPISIARL